MFYRYAINVTSGTTQANPESLDLGITFGDLTYVSLAFPAGVQALAGIRLKYHEHVIYPEQQEEWITGEDEQIVLSTDYQIYERPYKLLAEAYNTDDTYDHTLTVRLQVIFPERLWLSLIYKQLQTISAQLEKPKLKPVVIFKKDLLKPEPWRK